MKLILNKYTCSYLDDVKQFYHMVESLTESYPDKKDYIFYKIGITDDFYNDVRFTHINFRNCLNLYLKVKSKGGFSMFGDFVTTEERMKNLREVNNQNGES